MPSFIRSNLSFFFTVFFIIAIAVWIYLPGGIDRTDLVFSQEFYDGYPEEGGYRISEPLSLNEIKNVVESQIRWEADTPLGTSVIVKTAVTDNNSDEPKSWVGAVNEGPIPGIIEGANLTGKFLWTKQILETDDLDNPDATPQLHSLTETITTYVETEGYRISPEFVISRQGDAVKDSWIFWQADERFDGTINVKVNVFAGGEWNYEQEVVNGGRIPGLEPGKSLSGARIQTKTSFVGGPHFYPSLENIKIFIEIEEIE